MKKDDNITVSAYYSKKDMIGIFSQHYLREVLALSLHRCMNAVNARSGSIFLFDDEKRELVLEIAENPCNISLEGVRTPIGERVVGKVALERKPLLVENIDSELSLMEQQKFNHYESKSFLSVPLEYSENLVGVLNVTDKIAGTPFNDTDLKSILNICQFISIYLSGVKSCDENQDKINGGELEDLKKFLDHSQKFSSLGKFVGGVIHEVNNPLDGVIRYVNLAFDCIEDGIGKEYLNEARVGLSRIAKIIRSLRDFSWSLSSKEGSIDLNRTIEESLFMLNHYIIAHNVEVRKTFTPNLTFIPDYHLKLAFNNIIKNACESMKKGGILSISTAMTDGLIEIKFSDTGEGISSDIKDRIFEPFFTTRNMGEGTGLGLAITYEIVKRYKGNIFVESERHRGASFIIQLPLNSNGKKL